MFSALARTNAVKYRVASLGTVLFEHRLVVLRYAPTHLAVVFLLNLPVTVQDHAATKGKAVRQKIDFPIPDVIQPSSSTASVLFVANNYVSLTLHVPNSIRSSAPSRPR